MFKSIPWAAPTVHNPLFANSRLSSDELIPAPNVTAACFPVFALMTLVTVLYVTDSAPFLVGTKNSKTLVPFIPETANNIPDGASFLL